MAKKDAVKKAEATIAAAHESAAAGDVGLPVAVMQDVPMLRVEVLPGQTCSKSDTMYAEGEQFDEDGPSALSLAQLGYVKIVGPVT